MVFNVKIVKVIYKSQRKSTGKYYPAKIFYFSYNSETLFKELFIYVKESLDFYDRSNFAVEPTGNTILNYIIHDEKIEWLVPIEECIIEDYLETYKLNEIVLFTSRDIGGLSFPEVDWICICNMLVSIGQVLSLAIDVYEAKRICSEFCQKFINYKRGKIPANIVEDLIKSRDFWAFSDIKMRLNLEIDNSVIVLLYLAGYLYDEKTNLYYFNKTLSQKNQKEFIKAVNEYLETHDVNDIVREP